MDSKNFKVDFSAIEKPEDLEAAMAAVKRLDDLVTAAREAERALSKAESAYWSAVGALGNEVRSGILAVQDNGGDGDEEVGARAVVTVPGYLGWSDYGEDVETASAFDLWVPSHLGC